MNKKNILFICGSKQEALLMYAISKELTMYDCFFSTYYADGWLDILARNGFLERTMLSRKTLSVVEKILVDKGLHIDYRGLNHLYDLVILPKTAIIPKNIYDKKIILIENPFRETKPLSHLLSKYISKININYLASANNPLSDSKICVTSSDNNNSAQKIASYCLELLNDNLMPKSKYNHQEIITLS